MRSILAAALILLTACQPARATPPPIVASLQKLSNAGNAEATYHLGMIYHVGAGVPQDHTKALALFRKAAAAGEPLAAYKLGCYYDGQGEGLVAFDPDAALLNKLVAAQAGYALAQQDVAVLYAQRNDFPQALAWLDKATAQGWTGALSTAASVYNGAPGVPKDPARVAAYFRLFTARIDPSPQQKAWLAGFEAKLSPADSARAEAIVRAYRPAPTPLTLKALSGQRAAEALVAGQR